MEPLDVVGLGGGVAAALLGDDVHDDGAVLVGGVAQRPLEAFDVVAVEGPDVVDAEVLEERPGLEVLAQGGGGGLEALLELVGHRHALDELLEAGPLAPVLRVDAHPGHRVGEPRHGGGVGAAVVVEHDDGLAARVAQVVEPLERHAAGHRPVADDGDHAALGAGLDAAVVGRGGAELDGGGQAVGVAHHRRGVAVLDPVVHALGAAGVAREAAPLAEPDEVVAPAGDDLVDVGLVAGVPEEQVARRVEHPVQGECELHGAEVGAEVAAGPGDGVDDELADLDGEGRELGVGEPPDVVGPGDGLEDHVVANGTSRPPRRPTRRIPVRCRCATRHADGLPGDGGGGRVPPRDLHAPLPVVAAVPLPRRRGARRHRPWRARGRRSSPRSRRAGAARRCRHAALPRRCPPPGAHRRRRPSSPGGSPRPGAASPTTRATATPRPRRSSPPASSTTTSSSPASTWACRPTRWPGARRSPSASPRCSAPRASRCGSSRSARRRA